MNVGMYRGVKAMEASERRLAAITSNLANLRSTAYKRVAAVQHTEAKVDGKNDHSGVQTNLSIDWTQGPLERTGVSTDIALRGEGFFAVEGPQGEVYTRDGQFVVTEGGDLVTQDGFPVAWDGARGVIDSIGEALVVGLDGSVTQGGQNLGKLKLVDFESRESLNQQRHGYFVASPALKQIPADAEVHQYSLEGSNVSSVEELVRLIETQRAFEAGARVVQLIGESYQRLNSSARR